jgi:hypothetical protein
MRATTAKSEKMLQARLPTKKQTMVIMMEQDDVGEEWACSACCVDRLQEIAKCFVGRRLPPLLIGA